METKEMEAKNVERLVLRTEYDKYKEQETILACFPDDEVTPGNIGCVSFSFNEDGSAYFDPYGEATMGYYYTETKPLRDKEMVQKCVEKLEAYYAHFYGGAGIKFKVIQRIWRR